MKGRAARATLHQVLRRNRHLRPVGDRKDLDALLAAVVAGLLVVAFVAVKTRDRHKLRLADTDDAKRASDREVEMFMIFSFYALLFSSLLDGKVIVTANCDPREE